MREIKFRVRDKIQNVWLDYDEIYVDQEGEIYLIEERTWSYQSYMHKENITEKVEVMQYTGLKDKNGKEIYEGDIVKWSRIAYTDCSKKEIHEKVDILGTVYWCETIWAIQADNGVGHLLLPYYIETDEFEVIGNIYENPELIKD